MNSRVKGLAVAAVAGIILSAGSLLYSRDGMLFTQCFAKDTPATTLQRDDGISHGLSVSINYQQERGFPVSYYSQALPYDEQACFNTGDGETASLKATWHPSGLLLNLVIWTMLSGLVMLDVRLRRRRKANGTQFSARSRLLAIVGFGALTISGVLFCIMYAALVFDRSYVLTREALVSLHAGRDMQIFFFVAVVATLAALVKLLQAIRASLAIKKSKSKHDKMRNDA